MKSRLAGIGDWTERSASAGYNVSELLAQLHVSASKLRRFFLRKYGLTPKKWLEQERQRRARALLVQGRTAHEVASELGFRHATNFVRAFKALGGMTPKRAVSSGSRSKNKSERK